jgi:hypothetical protein
MGVDECEAGFLLSEVPLGEGILDLPEVVGVLQRARPDVEFNLEMITRDPLRVPCLTKEYYATFDALPASDLAHLLALVKQHPPRQPLPRTSDKTDVERLAYEEENVRKSFACARERLGL